MLAELVPLLAGVVAGTLGASAVARFVSTLMGQVPPAGAAVWVAAAVVFAASSVAAVLLGSRALLRIEPAALAKAN
jgi:hypothetical protein